MLTPEAIAPERFRRLERVEYDRMVAMGLFEDERVELLEGMIVEMSPQDASHSHAIMLLTMLLVPKLTGRALVGVQLPFAATVDSEPEPDLAIVPIADYSAAHPSRALLVVEVAVSSLRTDREVKARIYARAGVPEYWVVDVARAEVEVFTAPRGARYARKRRVGLEQPLAIQAFPDIVLRPSQFLKPPAKTKRRRPK